MDRSYLIGALMMVLAFVVRAETSERVALVVGNSAYPKAPLTNPGKDARDMASLLRKAGFVVDQQLDATQGQLSRAVARFGATIKDPKVKFALFYYAGHGLQQDWRNNLVPVSADIRSAADVQSKTVDVGELLAYMDQAKGRGFPVILDAYRDDPFAGNYRPAGQRTEPVRRTRFEARGFNMQLNARLERNIWVAPGVSGDIAHEILVRLRNGAIERNHRQELASFRQAGQRTATR